MKVLNIIFVIVLPCLTLFTCKKDPQISGESNQLVYNEIIQEAILADIDYSTWYALQNNPQLSTDGISLRANDRIDCIDTKIIYSNIADDKSSGNVVIDFGTSGCTDKKGNNRKGRIEINWTNGKWFSIGSTQTITLNGYSINNISVTGTRNYTCTASNLQSNFFYVNWRISADHTLTWPDLSTASRTVSGIFSWGRGGTENSFGLSGDSATVSGINRYKQPYSINITQSFHYSDSCRNAHKVYMPITGDEEIMDQGTSKKIRIQVATGYCTNEFVITADGVREFVKVNDDFTW